MITPPALHKSDVVAITATARKISKDELQPALDWLTENGYQYTLAPGLFEEENQLAGSDAVRQKALQWCLDHPKAKAIWIVRGGYGTVRILDGLDYTQFANHPKWITGYSDISALHGEINRLGYKSIHATMPINVRSNTPEALRSLMSAWAKKYEDLQAKPHPLNINGEVRGRLVGGNLSVLYSTLGSMSEPPLDGNILLLEDLDEYLYHIDRMFMNFKRNGWWHKVSGVVVGGMTDMNDNTIPFGESAVEIIHRHLKGRGIPLGFNFPIGHIDDNRAVVLCKKVKLEVDGGSQLSF